MLPFSFCYAPVVAGAMIAALLDGIPAVSVPYHRIQMQRASERMQEELDARGGAISAEHGLADWNHHRDRLVELGAVRRTVYVFKNVTRPSPRSTAITRELLGRKCPSYVDFSSPHPAAAAPLQVTLWHEPETAAAWAKFFAERDVKK